MILMSLRLMIIYFIMLCDMKVDFKKRFGQNFLIDNVYTNLLVKSANVFRSDLILEVGSGHGAVTERILKRCKKVFAVEIDDDFVELLKSRFKNYILKDQLKIIHEDILSLDISKIIGDEKYKVIGSLPYNISKKIIMKFLESKDKPSIMSFILQKEVAKNYTTVSPKATFLSNYAEIFSKATFIKSVPKESFKPKPKVDGGIITFQMKKEHIEDYRKFIRFLKSSFMMPRKKLVNNLSGIYRIDKIILKGIFREIGINEDARASVLEFSQWVSLYEKIREEK